MPYTLSNAPIPGGIGDTFIPAMLSCAGCGSTGTCKCSSSGGTNQASSSEDIQTPKTAFMDKLREKAAKNVEILAKEAVATAASAAVTTLAPVPPPRDLRSPTILPIVNPKEPETVKVDALSSPSHAQLPVLELEDQVAQGQPSLPPAIAATDTPALSGTPVPHQAPNPNTRHHPSAMNPWPASGSEKSIDSEQSSRSERSHRKTRESESDPELIEDRGK